MFYDKTQQRGSNCSNEADLGDSFGFVILSISFKKSCLNFPVRGNIPASSFSNVSCWKSFNAKTVLRSKVTSLDSGLSHFAKDSCANAWSNL